MTLLAENSEHGEFGLYKFPFEIQLPANLPPNLNIDAENKIKYKITAQTLPNLLEYNKSTTREFKVKN